MEMLVRCIGPLGDEGRGSLCAQALLQEVGLGSTLPLLILSEYQRLRRIIPLEERYWRCEALHKLPLELPARPSFVFEHNRLRSLPPPPPPPTRLERCVRCCWDALYWLFAVVAAAALLLALNTLVYRRFFCSLTLPVLALSAIALVTMCYVSVLQRMAKVEGVGTIVAIVCCPIVSCNLAGLILALAWAVLSFLDAKSGACDMHLFGAAGLLLGFVGLFIAFAVLRKLLRHIALLASRVSDRCCQKGLPA